MESVCGTSSHMKWSRNSKADESGRLLKTILVFLLQDDKQSSEEKRSNNLKKYQQVQDMWSV